MMNAMKSESWGVVVEIPILATKTPKIKSTQNH